MRLCRVEVEAYAGYRGQQEPRSFTYGGCVRRVAEIVDRWYEGGLDPRAPKLDYFRISTEGGGTFLLRYNSLFNAWALVDPPVETETNGGKKG